MGLPRQAVGLNLLGSARVAMGSWHRIPTACLGPLTKPGFRQILARSGFVNCALAPVTKPAVSPSHHSPCPLTSMEGPRLSDPSSSEYIARVANQSPSLLRHNPQQGGDLGLRRVGECLRDRPRLFERSARSSPRPAKTSALAPRAPASVQAGLGSGLQLGLGSGCFLPPTSLGNANSLTCQRCCVSA